uniref:Peroxisome assembly protein 12 n=1 Tax=Strongyloides venezuelensis TaxID=75913 RepID=A0A0K0EWC4_STRVS
MYLFGYVPIHNIEMLLAGVFYQKYSAFDLKLMESRKVMFDSSNIFGRFVNFIIGLFSKFGKILSFLLIGIQVLQYVQESNDGSINSILNIFKSNSSGERKSDIQFPVKKLDESEALNLSKDQCPLCLKKRENDTVLSSSGYIFCYKCIRQHISKFGRCPVTSTPATLNQLVRLYL